MRNDFAVFILSHGRADNVKTFKTLKKQGYTGKIYIVIDDEDEQEPLYYKRYGKQVYKFCKQKYIDLTDTMCSEPFRKVVVYARNAAWDIAADTRCLKIDTSRGASLKRINLKIWIMFLKAFYSSLILQKQLRFAWRKVAILSVVQNLVRFIKAY